MSKRFDIVIWGATGYTGSCIADYFAENYPPSSKVIKWAIAGRSASKLDKIKQDIIQIDQSCKEIEILVADSSNSKELDQIVSQTKVLISAAGPYTYCGTPIVDSCVRMGVHYCDITGEFIWVKKIIDKYDSVAKENKIFIVPMCGFDSVPSDLGAFMMVEYARTKYNDSIKNVSVYFSDFTRSKVGFAGGTPRSMLAVFEDTPFSKMSQVRDPNYLISSGHPKFKETHSDYSFWKENKTFHLYPAINPMSFVNKKTVYRSAFLLKYGSQFSYNEYIGMKSLLRATVLSIFLIIISIIFQVPLLRSLYSSSLKESGKGPDKQLLKTQGGNFSLKIKAVTSKGRVITGSVISEKDFAYFETAKMTAESAICLVLHSNDILASGTHGGIHTPASSLGKYLLERLRNSKMQWSIDQ